MPYSCLPQLIAEHSPFSLPCKPHDNLTVSCSPGQNSNNRWLSTRRPLRCCAMGHESIGFGRPWVLQACSDWVGEAYTVLLNLAMLWALEFNQTCHLPEHWRKRKAPTHHNDCCITLFSRLSLVINFVSSILANVVLGKNIDGNLSSLCDKC